MKRLTAVFLILLVFFSLSGNRVHAQQMSNSRIVEGVVKEIKDKNVTVEIKTDPLKGKTFQVKDQTVKTVKELHYRVGETVILTYSKNPDGTELFYITDYDRKTPLFLLFILFALTTLLIARKKGLASLVGMALSFFVIGRFIIPNILIGSDPLTITFLGSLVIIPLSFYLAHGINRKTTIAIASTLLTLILTSVLAYFFILFTRLTGFDTEEALFLNMFQNGAINAKSLLLAGIMIGLLAVLDDITISQTSVVERLKMANPRFTRSELYHHAMEIGKDHIASLVNTLILVYTSASLPLFLLFYNTPTPVGLIVNQEMVAAEIVRTLVSSIGIIAAVPVSTYLACVFEKNS